MRGFGDYKAFEAKKLVADKKRSQKKRMDALTKRYKKKDDPLEYLKNYINKIEWVDGERHCTIVNIIYKFKELELTFDQIVETIQNNVAFSIEIGPLSNLR